MQLAKLLHIQHGITAVIGSGGKTTLVHTLAHTLQGTVIVCTTTQMFPSPSLPVLYYPTEAKVTAALQKHRAIFLATPAANGKCKAPEIPFDRLQRLADFVLVEADGAHQLPLKAHGPREPVIPPGSNQVICIAGASGFGQRVCDAVHRPERFAALAGVDLQCAIQPEMAAYVIRAEQLADRVFLNQVDTPAALPLANAFAQQLLVPVAGGSLQQQNYFCLPVRK